MAIKTNYKWRNKSFKLNTIKQKHDKGLQVYFSYVITKMSEVFISYNLYYFNYTLLVISSNTSYSNKYQTESS